MAEMDARLAQLHEQLDSMDCSTFLPSPQPRTIASGSTTLGTRVHRRAPAALLQRLQTFRPSTWFGKPDSLSAPACAARGWCNTGHDLLTCEYCGRKLSCKLPANLASSAGAALVAKYTSSLSSSHEEACPWATFTVDPCQPSFPVSTNVRLAADFHTRQQGLVSLDRVPPVAATTPGSLLSATTTPAAAAGDGGVVAAGGAARKEGSSSSRTAEAAAEAVGALSQALADLLQLQPQQLAAASSSSSGSSRGQVVLLRPQQVPTLLSLLGWQVQQLLPGVSNAGAPAGTSHPSILPHLITRAPSPDLHHQQQQQAQQQQVAAANCCLSCGLCGAKVPLWSYCKTGPLYLTTLARQAAAQGMLQCASHLTASASGAAAAAGGAAAGPAEAGGDAGGPIMGTPPAAGGGRMQAPRSSSLPPLPPSHHSLHRGPSPQPSSTPVAAGGGAATGGGEGRQGTPGASGSPTAAVAIAMHQTIAGGALVSPRVSPTAAAGPFGSHPAPSFADAAAAADDGGEDGADAGELPAFGLAALAAQESAARRRSGSPGVTQVGSPGDGSGAARAPPGKRGREEGGGAASPAAAHSGAVGGAADAPGAAAGGHAGGSNSSSKRPRRSFSPLDSSAVQSALGLADAPRPSSAVPASALLQQPSLLGPATVADAELGAEGVDGGLTAAGIDLFDPVGAHRSWCPWVATPGSPSSSFLTAADAMEGSQGSGSRGGGSSSRRGQFRLEQLQLGGAPGWVQALVAVAQQQAAFSSRGRAGGGRGGGGGVRGVGGAQQQQEEEEDSGQVMARASWVLQALGDV
jgi:hypothetical protein